MTGDTMTPDLDAIVELRKAWQAADLGAPRMKAYYAYCKATDAFDFAALAARLAALEGASIDGYEAWLIEHGHLSDLNQLARYRRALTPDPDSEERTA